MRAWVKKGAFGFLAPGMDDSDDRSNRGAKFRC